MRALTTILDKLFLDKTGKDTCRARHDRIVVCMKFNKETSVTEKHYANTKECKTCMWTIMAEVVLTVVGANDMQCLPFCVGTLP